jgi:hypothetical protein
VGKVIFMQLDREVKTFSVACEHMLTSITVSPSLTRADAIVIGYCCQELLAKVAPLLSKQE